MIFDQAMPGVNVELRGRTAGFTGTRRGMDAQQKAAVQRLLILGEYAVAVHGGCVGADADFHEIATELQLETQVRWGHPKNNPTNRSHAADLKGDVEHPSKSHFARNRDIVDQCDVLIACPHGGPQVGGTWNTIEYARKTDRPIILVYPEHD